MARKKLGEAVLGQHGHLAVKVPSLIIAHVDTMGVRELEQEPVIGSARPPTPAVILDWCVVGRSRGVDLTDTTGCLAAYVGEVGKDIDPTFLEEGGHDGRFAVAFAPVAQIEGTAYFGLPVFWTYPTAECQVLHGKKAYGTREFIKALGLRPATPEVDVTFQEAYGPAWDRENNPIIAKSVCAALSSGIAGFKTTGQLSVKASKNGRSVTKKITEAGVVFEGEHQALKPMPGFVTLEDVDVFVCTSCAKKRPIEEKIDVGGVGICASCASKAKPAPTAPAAPEPVAVEPAAEEPAVRHKLEPEVINRPMLNRTPTRQDVEKCTVKLRFESKEEAQVAADKEKRSVQRPYNCDICGSWHLTTAAYGGETFNGGLVPFKVGDPRRNFFVFLAQPGSTYDEIVDIGFLVASKEPGKVYEDIHGKACRRWEMWMEIDPIWPSVGLKQIAEDVAAAKKRSVAAKFSITTDPPKPKARPAAAKKISAVKEVPVDDEPDFADVPDQGVELCEPIAAPEPYSTIDDIEEDHLDAIDRLVAMEANAEFRLGAIWMYIQKARR